MGRLISTATLLAFAIGHLDGAAHIYSYSVTICPSVLGWGGSYLLLLCEHMSSCTWIGRLISKLLCGHMPSCTWMGRLISTATLLAFAIGHLDGAAHNYSYSVSICHRVL
ncbi:hypothetical protein DPMN_009387 [Dreissena polymorpha]|uniref:Uncharacterized protein n=1 Tax=Dreissena polymorpha TaxID=45954 RepID=A0A9D4N153_DREPO|nr:hypothetical protein DPMN_009387 [Dreissena polymorpha]